jgi:hypothetical protein
VSSNKPQQGAKVHHVVHDEDGGFRIPSLKPTEDMLLRHARKYGAEGVYETAEPIFGEKALGRLRIELDSIEAGRKSGGFTVGKRRRRSKAETREAVLALSVDGLVVPAIADKFGLSDFTVKQHLRATGATAF